MFLQPRIGTCRTRQDSSSRSQQVHPTCVRYVMPLAAEEAPLNGSTLSNLKGGRVIPVVGDGYGRPCKPFVPDIEAVRQGRVRDRRVWNGSTDGEIGDGRYRTFVGTDVAL